MGNKQPPMEPPTGTPPTEISPTGLPRPTETAANQGVGVKQAADYILIDGCNCEEMPIISVDSGEIGPYHVQEVYCEECLHRFGGIVRQRGDFDG